MIVGRRAEAGAKASAQKSSEQQRMELLAAAQQSFAQILETFVACVLEAAPSATVARAPSLVVRLGDGVLAADQVRSAPPACLANPHGSPPFDVVAYTAIAETGPLGPARERLLAGDEQVAAIRRPAQIDQALVAGRHGVAPRAAGAVAGEPDLVEPAAFREVGDLLPVGETARPPCASGGPTRRVPPCPSTSHAATIRLLPKYFSTTWPTPVRTCRRFIWSNLE